MDAQIVRLKAKQSLRVKFRIEKSMTTPGDEPYCKTKVGEKQVVHFQGVFPKLESKKSYPFQLMVSGGKTAQGISESFQWSYKDYLAEPITKNKAKEM